MRSSILRALIFGCFLGLLGAGWSMILHAHGLTDKDEVWIENAFTGTVAGGLVFFYLEERRLRTSKRMDEIAFLNHHIRNALNAINLSSYAADDSVRLEIVADASRRIENTLRKLSEQEHVALEPTDDNG
jgi:hypothetical protein